MDSVSFGQLTVLNWKIMLLYAVWVFPWKGWALWKAARLGHRKWFIAVLVLNTLAILDIFYIFAVAKKAERRAEAGNGPKKEEIAAEKTKENGERT